MASKFTAEQKAAIAADRAKVRAEQPAPEPLKKPFDPADFQNLIRDALAGSYVDPAISGKRKLVAFFASIALSFGAGYLIGKLASAAIVGIIMLGGSVIWAYLLMIIAILLASYAGMKVGQHVGNYVLSGQVDRDIAKAKNKLTSLFSRSKSKLVPA